MTECRVSLNLEPRI